jgi:hypothetical protein
MSPEVNSSLAAPLFSFIAALSALVFLFLASPLLTGGVFTFDDQIGMNLPMRYIFSKALHTGESWLWAPQLNCGMYLHGESEVGMSHPLHYLIYRFLPLAAAFATEFLSNYLWMFLGMYFFLRRLLFDKASSLAGAVFFSFSGFNLLHFHHPAPLGTIAQIPWLLLANDLIMCSRDRKQVALAQFSVSLLTASECMMGHPQFGLFSIIAEVVFLFARSSQWVSRQRLGLWLLAKALGGGIGAIQLLPVWDFVKDSTRGDATTDFKLSFSLHPYNLMQLVSPFALKERYFAELRWLDGNTHEMGLYSGAFCTVAMAWFALRWRQLASQRVLLITTFLLGVGALVLAFGKYAVVYPLLIKLPVLELLAFRCPTRFIILFHLSLSILSCFALHDLCKLNARGEVLPWTRMWPLVIPVLLSLVACILVGFTQTTAVELWSKNVGTPSGGLWGLLLIGTATLLVALAARGKRWAIFAIMAVAFTEVAVWGLCNHIIRQGPIRTIPMVVKDLPPPPSREGRLGYFEPSSAFVLDGFQLMRGYAGPSPAKRLPIDLNNLRLANVHWAFIENQWLRVPSPVSRARLVSRTVIGKDAAALLPSLDITTTSVLENPVEIDGGTPGHALIVKDQAGWIQIKTEAVGRQLLVLSESYNKGWVATENGKQTPVLRVNGDYLGCIAGQGERRIEFRFEPSSFKWGLRISCAAFIFSVICLFVSYLGCGATARYK